MASEGLIVRDLHRDDDPKFLDRFYGEVLAASFRPEELDTLESIADGLRGRDERVVLVSVALGPSRQVLGGLVAERHRDSEVLLVGYLAVRPDQRGRGIGSALMRRARAQWSADENIRLALGEVHDPRRWEGVDPDDPMARLRFFARLDALLLDVPFIQPALHPGGRRVPGFLLLAFYVDASLSVNRGGQQGIPAQVLSRFVRDYYEHVEKAKPPYDPELSSLLDRIEGTKTVPLLPLDLFRRNSQEFWDGT